MNLPEANLRSKRLSSLVEEASRKHNVDFVMWILVSTLVQVYVKEEKAEQEEM